LKALEERIANQEKSAKEIEDKALKLEEENRKLKKMVTTKEQALQEEKSKGFFKRLLG